MLRAKHVRFPADNPALCVCYALKSTRMQTLNGRAYSLSRELSVQSKRENKVNRVPRLMKFAPLCTDSADVYREMLELHSEGKRGEAMGLIKKANAGNGVERRSG